MSVRRTRPARWMAASALAVALCPVVAGCASPSPDSVSRPQAVPTAPTAILPAVAEAPSPAPSRPAPGPAGAPAPAPSPSAVPTVTVPAPAPTGAPVPAPFPTPTPVPSASARGPVPGTSPAPPASPLPGVEVARVLTESATGATTAASAGAMQKFADRLGDDSIDTGWTYGDLPDGVWGATSFYANGSGLLADHTSVVVSNRIPNADAEQWVVDHEFGHVLEAHLYAGLSLDQMDAALNAHFGGGDGVPSEPGQGGVERAADCIARLLGGNVAWHAYDACDDPQWQSDASRLLFGHRLS